jgi:hypothetical protein
MNPFSLLLTFSLLIGQADAADGSEREPQPPAPILIDWIHSNDFSMVGLRPGIYDYHASCGFRHGFDFLESRGVGHDYVSQGRLTPERLADHKLLFINLVSAEREPFLVSEVMAIRAFVENGGSLLIVTDHSNCYFHSHRLKPLLSVLGIRSFTDTACDVPPHTLGIGNGWLAITTFRPHPVTRGLRRLGFQTGGRVDPRYAIALTSDQSWADQWSVAIYGEGEVGFYGDFKREEPEPFGPHGVVLAREFHKGRILIVGDQNMWGDAFMNYADNYRLWLNSLAWLLRDPKLADWKPYEVWHGPRVVLYEPADKPRFGSVDNGDYYNTLCLLARHYWTFANDRLDERADLRVVANGQRTFSPAEREHFTRYLHGGGRILVLPDTAEAGDDDSKNFAVDSLVSCLDISSTERHSTQHTSEYLYPSGGRLVVLDHELTVDNEHLAPPVRVPNAEERERADQLLEIVRSLCNGSTDPAAPGG